MVHEVLKNLDKVKSVTIEMVKDKLCTLLPYFPSVSTTEVLGGSTHVGTLKRGMFRADVLMVLLRKRVKLLVER